MRRGGLKVRQNQPDIHGTAPLHNVPGGAVSVIQSLGTRRLNNLNNCASDSISSTKNALEADPRLPFLPVVEKCNKKRRHAQRPPEAS